MKAGQAATMGDAAAALAELASDPPPWLPERLVHAEVWRDPATGGWELTAQLAELHPDPIRAMEHAAAEGRGTLERQPDRSCRANVTTPGGIPLMLWWYPPLRGAAPAKETAAP